MVRDRIELGIRGGDDGFRSAMSDGSQQALVEFERVLFERAFTLFTCGSRGRAPER